MEIISATRFPGQIYGKEVWAKKLETDCEEIFYGVKLGQLCVNGCKIVQT